MLDNEGYTRMGYWGWRQMLMCGVSVLVVACSTIHDAAPTYSPTQLPPVTLLARVSTESPPPAVWILPQSSPVSAPTPIYYTIQVGDTLLGIAAQFGVPVEVLKTANADLDPLALPVNQTMVIPDPQFDVVGTPILPTLTPVQLELPSPTCYPTPTETILCMGWVANNILRPVDRVVLNVRLLRRDGSVLAEGDAGVEQGVIPTGASASYRVLFAAKWLDYSAAVVTLRSADIAATNRRGALQIEDEQQHYDNQTYIVSATLRNASPETVRLVRALLTLRDGQGHVTGYKVISLSGELAANAVMNLDIGAVSQTPDSVGHTLFVEVVKQE